MLRVSFFYLWKKYDFMSEDTIRKSNGKCREYAMIVMILTDN